MVGMLLELGRYPVLNRTLNLLDRPPGSDSGSVSNPEDVGVHRLCRVAKPHVEHNVCSLATDTGKRLQITLLALFR